MKTLFLTLFLFFSFNLFADDIYYTPNRDTTEVEIIEEKNLPVEVHHYNYSSYENRIRNFYWRPIFVFNPTYYHYHWFFWGYYYHPFSFYAYHYWYPMNFHFYTWTPIYYGHQTFYYNYSSGSVNNNTYYGHRNSTGSTINRGEGRDINSHQVQAEERRERLTTNRTYMRPDYRNTVFKTTRKRPNTYTQERSQLHRNEIMQSRQEQSRPPTRATQPPQQNRPPVRVNIPPQRLSSPPNRSSQPSRSQKPNRK